MEDIKFFDFNEGNDADNASNYALAVLEAPGDAPGIFYLNGYASNMLGTKATALADLGRELKRQVTRFDYSGHGTSQGQFEQGTIGLWLEQALAVYRQFAHGTQVLVGSSMGGYLALLLNRLIRTQSGLPPVKALVLIAPAVDMTEELMWQSFDDKTRKKLLADGAIYQQSPMYDPLTITRKLIEEGRNHLLMARPIISFCPVHIIHGCKDIEVPFNHSLKLIEGLIESNVVLTLVKDGDHRLSRPADIDRILSIVTEYL